MRAAEAGADVGDGLVLVRSVSADGRSRAHVGGRAAPVGVLAELAEHLVAVHGQADQWRLRRADQHREVLDGFGGREVADALAAYRALHVELTAAEAELAHLRTAAAERAREADALRVGLERIEALDPQPGEDATLGIESQRLGHAEELRAGAGAAHTALAGDDDAGMPSPGVLEALATASSRLASVSGSDPALAEIGTRVDELRYLAADVAADLGSYLADADIDPARLEQVEQRRAALRRADPALRPHRRRRARLGRARPPAGSTSSTAPATASASSRSASCALTAAREDAAAGSPRCRTAAAAALGARITDELSHLAMGSATVSVAVEDAGRFTTDGRDDIEIRLASGSGTAPRAVTKAASGGELSRVMLAIEVATATEVTSVPTFVFDEVDAGVGGRAALDVGARLAALARHAQVRRRHPPRAGRRARRPAPGRRAVRRRARHPQRGPRGRGRAAGRRARPDARRAPAPTPRWSTPAT